MTKKQVEQELYFYKMNKVRVRNLSLEIETIKREYQGVKGQGFEDNGGGGTNAISRSVEDEVIRKDARIERLITKRDKVQNKIDKIDNALATLEDVQRQIIELRYFERHDWMYVSDMVGYTYQWVNKLNNNALSDIGLMLSL